MVGRGRDSKRITEKENYGTIKLTGCIELVMRLTNVICSGISIQLHVQIASYRHYSRCFLMAFQPYDQQGA